LNKQNLLFIIIFLSALAGLIFGYNVGVAYAELINGIRYLISIGVIEV